VETKLSTGLIKHKDIGQRCLTLLSKSKGMAFDKHTKIALK